MEPDTKKKLVIFGCIGAAIVAAIFIKNKIEEKKFQPIDRNIVIDILKKARKQNFGLLKQVAALSSQIAAQMKISQIDPQMVRGYFQSEQSPIKISEMFEKNYSNICKSSNVTYNQFNESVDYYIKKQDKEIQQLVNQCESDYNTSLSGRLPQIKVTVPSNLTKERLIDIQKKLTLKKYLVQVDLFRKLRGKTQQQLMANPELMNGIPKPEEEEEKILEEQGIGSASQPATAVFAAAVTQFRNDQGFKESIHKIQNHYAKIYNKYTLKIQQNKITQSELSQLEDELIYNQI